MSQPVEQFPYLDRDPSANGAGLMPYMTLSLSHQKQTVAVEGLLDSGAVVNVIPYEVGLQLGFVWDQQTIPVRLGGNLALAEARAVAVTGTVGRLPPVLLAFAWTRSQTVPVILGQLNFFQEFDVCFFRSRALFEVRSK
jgi:hypothetical protein